MNESLARVGVVPGDGLVARFGAAVVLFDASASASSEFREALLDRLETGSAANSGPASDFVWAIAQMLVSHGDSVPTFAAAVRLEHGIALLLRGDVRALVSGTAGDLELTGRTALTWVDHVVEDVDATITITPAGQSDVEVDPRYDLRVGLVPGSGFVLNPQAVAEPTPAPAPAPEKVAEPEPEPAPEPAPVMWPEPEPAPVMWPEPEPAPAAAAEPEPILQPTTVTPQQPTPQVRGTVHVPAPTAVLVADDGTRTPLDRNYVFGREPQFDPSVTSGTAIPLIVRDPENLVSRVQAYLSVRDGVVTIRDAGSANGTFVAAPGAPDWDRLAEHAFELPVGWSIRMGQRVFVYTSAQ